LPRVFPFPAHLGITIASATNASIRFSFGGKPDDIVRPTSLVKIGNNRLILIAEGGPNKSKFRLEAVLKNERLVGVAKMVLPDGSLLGAGSFEARRK
jgi:hypothetical protein